MTPLSDALRRLALAEESASAGQAAANATTPVAEEVCASETILDSAGESATDEQVAAVPHAEVHADDGPGGIDVVDVDLAIDLLDEIPQGVINLYCDLATDSQLAFLTAAQTSDLVVRLAYDAPAVATAAEAPANAIETIRWPKSHSRSLLPAPDGVTFAQLTPGEEEFNPREWVLTLDDCRREFATTALIVPESATAELDWLAERCDSVSLVTRSGSLDSAAARRLANRLRKHTPAPPTCLLVRAA